MIFRMLRWTLRKERSLMPLVLANVAFWLVPLAAGKRRLCRPLCRFSRAEIRVQKWETVKELGFIGSWRQEQTIEITRARLI
jgi:hypothetical protein